MRLDNLCQSETLKSQLKERSLGHELASIKTQDISQYEAEGWKVIRRGKQKTQIRRPKELSRWIEDRIWVVLYKMGFLQMSGEGGARLFPCADSESKVHNQLDTVAIDNDVAIVVECKTALEPKSNPNLQDELAALTDICSSVRLVLRTESISTLKLRVGGVLVLYNVEPSESDLERAKEKRLLVLDANGLEYYEKLVEHIGSAARYQFLAEVFADQEIDGLRITVPAVEARVGLHSTYTFLITPEQLLRLSFVSHRARGELGTIGAYQRLINKNRLAAIKEYIDEGGFFPTNIIVNFAATRRDGKSDLRFEKSVQADDALDNVKLGWLHLPARYQSAWIIDGQHRLLAYDGHPYAKSAILSVTAFNGLKVDEQAKLFIDINSKQKKVDANLLVQLYAGLHFNSTNFDEQVYSVVSQAFQDLAQRISSPFYRRIKIADEPSTFTRCITLKSVVDEFKKPGFFFVRKSQGKVVEYGPLWAAKGSDAMLRRAKKIIDGWFAAIIKDASDIWKLGKQEGGYLAMNDGVVSCLEVLRSVFDHLDSQGVKGVMLPEDELILKIQPFGNLIGEYFGTLLSSELTQFRKRRSTEGQAYATKKIQSMLHDQLPEFNPTGLAEWMAQRADVKLPEARQLIVSIDMRLNEKVVACMKEHFGLDRNQWWPQMPSQVRVSVTSRREKDNRARGDEETYLTIKECRGVALAHWQDIFQPIFAYGDKGNKQVKTEWLATLQSLYNKLMDVDTNELDKRDYDSLMTIHEWLSSRGV